MNAEIQRAVTLANDGYWDEAHQIVQVMNDPTAFWLHANLHREEGDHNNAQYWYTRAQQPFSKESLLVERQQILLSMQGE